MNAPVTFQMALYGDTEDDARAGFVKWAAAEPKVTARLVGLARTKDRAWEWVGEVEVTPREQVALDLGLV